MLTFKRIYLLLFLLIFLVEICIALFVHDGFIRPFFGDFLATAFVYTFLKTFLRVSVKRAAILSLVIAYLIEFLQYIDFLTYSHLGQYKIVRVILGTSFSWEDMLAYTLGVVLVLLIEKNNSLNRPITTRKWYL